ncbi:hypothetical protein MBANPS3_001792, partial [Mucor bainieri]
NHTTITTMDRLPREIFNHITSYLTYSEKRKLLLVCRYWHQMIKNGNLFNNFGVKGHRKFEAAALFFHDNAPHRKQVRNLRLTKPEADLDYVLAVPEQFPWLEDFVWADYGTHPREMQSITDTTLEHWHHLTSFGEVNRYPLATEILKHGGFSSLTKLTVSFHFSGASCSALVQQLSNAPQLAHIDFASPNMALADLEQLHQNVPQLETLYLSGVVQEEEEEVGDLMAVTTTAGHLTTVWMRNMNLARGGFGLTDAWMAYMAAKYRQLESLTIDGVGMTRGRQDYYESRLAGIAARCPHLTTYKVNLFPLTSRIVSAMDGSHVKLKRVDITGDATEDQIQHLLHSQQCQSLETITMVDNTQPAPEALFSALEGFAQLRHVEIGYKQRQSVSLDVVLHKLRYLETLKLSTWHIWLDKGAISSSSTLKTRLRSLILEKSDIDTAHGDVMAFLASTCPHLSRLSIQGQIQDIDNGGGDDNNSAVFRVEFPHHYFTSIKLDLFGNEYYRVDNQRQATWYQFKGRSLVSSQPDDNTATLAHDQPHVSIVYQGSANLSIGGTDIPNW